MHFQRVRLKLSRGSVKEAYYIWHRDVHFVAFRFFFFLYRAYEFLKHMRPQPPNKKRHSLKWSITTTVAETILADRKQFFYKDDGEND